LSISFVTNSSFKFETFTPSGTTGIKEPVLKALEAYNSDASFVIVSDFLIEPETIEKSLKLIKTSKKEVTLFHILHPDEIDFDFRGSVEFQDMETAAKVIVDTGSIRHTYKKRIGEFIERLKLICHENETRYVFSPINNSIENSLIQIADK